MRDILGGRVLGLFLRFSKSFWGVFGDFFGGFWVSQWWFFSESSNCFFNIFLMGASVLVLGVGFVFLGAIYSFFGMIFQGCCGVFEVFGELLSGFWGFWGFLEFFWGGFWRIFRVFFGGINGFVRTHRRSITTCAASPLIPPTPPPLPPPPPSPTITLTCTLS